MQNILEKDPFNGKWVNQNIIWYNLKSLKNPS